VLILAANAKYSINSFFMPVLQGTLAHQKKDAKIPLWRADLPPGHMRIQRDFVMRTDLVTYGSGAAATLVLINPICLILVKGWFVNEV
jgi:hypothetical protein